MDTRSNRSEKGLFLASVLIIVGRLGLIVSVCLGLFAFALGYPLQPIGVVLAIPIAILLLLAAGHLIGAYLWLADVLVQCFAFGVLSLGAVIIRLYFGRDPNSVSSYEVVVLIACFVGFALSVFWLRRRRHLRRKTSKYRTG